VTSTGGVETERERGHLPVVLRQREREVTSAGGVETERERGDIYQWC